MPIFHSVTVVGESMIVVVVVVTKGHLAESNKERRVWLL
jgi:hypothetical protein